MHLSPAELAKLHAKMGNHQHASKHRKSNALPKVQDWHKPFLALCNAHGLPEPVFEYKFDTDAQAAARGEPKARKWAFDILFEGWLAVEKDGGAWVGGRHVSGEGFEADLAKLNAATLSGFAILRFTPKQINDGSACSFIALVLKGKEEQP